ncbi:MAG TPA: DUF4340 domain-containing protein [Planctomycetota bacterium]|nr:DUF4340 domain-containing protein [Planctomycetota bacterium]
MNEFGKTGVIAGAAVVLTALAMWMGPREVRLDLFDDQGQEFWQGFADGDAVAELEVAEFREATSDVYQFNVKRDDKGRWTIPSHGNYPADAKDRMGKAAAMLIGLKKDTVVDDSKARHVDFGVVDPLEPGVETAGRGKRITMKDSAGNVLADLIVGKEVEGKPGVHYVRVPDKKRTYRTKLDGELSTKFADWIETDLLKAQSWDIAKVTFDNYTVDEQKGEVVPGEKIVVSKDTAGKWTVDGLDTTKQDPNEEKLNEIGTTLGQIKIVGVRPKPEGLTARLERANGIEANILAQTLAAKGFFLGRGGKLFSNEGDLLFETKKGVRYTLRFGELVLGEGDELTSGAEPKPGKAPKDGETPPAKTGNHRYLMVTAEFDEALLQKPTGTRLPKDQIDKRAQARTAIEEIQRAVEAFRAKNENKLPETLAKLTEKPAEGDALLKELKKDPWDNDYVLQPLGDSYVVVCYADDKKEGGEGVSTDLRSDRLPNEDEIKKAADEWTAYDTKVEEGRKEGEKLTRRFGPWYYVIDQTLFAKLKPKRTDLVKDKPPPPAPAASGGEQPNK